MKLRKWEFFTKHIMYFGHKITLGQVQIRTAKVATLERASHPKTMTERRSFLGMCNGFWRFIE